MKVVYALTAGNDVVSIFENKLDADLAANRFNMADVTETVLVGSSEEGAAVVRVFNHSMVNRALG